jgi:DNA-binding phage protein
MPLTREFKETVQARLQSDRKYRKALLREGVECLLAGDLDSGKASLRDYINATIGFNELSRRTKRPAKSLMRMLGPSGNPQARNLLEVINHLLKAEGLHFEVSLRAASLRHADARCPSTRRVAEHGASAPIQTNDVG